MARDEYLEARVMTAAPHQLHLMVVDGAIRFARQAKQALEVGDLETAHLHLNRSRDFVSELISGLDKNQAADITERVHFLFSFAYRNLALADMEREPRMVKDALRILEMHRETWRMLCDQLTDSPRAAVGGEGGFSMLS
ncbi:MAG: flagellar export chaperone FliS [Planctomycetota bacterium]|nr:flagellar export chaperone FliS [Planctomycetota bacterium]